MGLNGDALPLHTDATLKIRPRIFLEGNFFVDMTPGSPSAPILQVGRHDPDHPDGRPGPARPGAQRAQQRHPQQPAGAARRLRHRADPRAHRRRRTSTQDPIVRGKTAARGAQRRRPALAAVRCATARSSTRRSAGEQPHDVSLLVASLGRVTGALGQNESDLQGLISNFDITLHAFAIQSAALELGGGVRCRARSPPPIVRFAALDAVVPGDARRSRSTSSRPPSRRRPTIAAALPWITQARALVTPAELGDLAQNLERAAPVLGTLTPARRALRAALDPVSRCLSQGHLPGGQRQARRTAPLSTGRPDYQEFCVRASSASTAPARTSTATAATCGRSSAAAASTSTPARSGFLGASVQGHRTRTRSSARATLPPQGTSPADPGVEPPLQPNVACDTPVAARLQRTGVARPGGRHRRGDRR